MSLAEPATVRRPRVPFSVFEELRVRSGLPIGEIARRAGISPTTISLGRKSGELPESTVNRVRTAIADNLKVLRDKVPARKTPKKIKAGDARRSREAQVKVPAGFIDDAVKALGISIHEYAKLVGTTAPNIYTYRKKGMAPSWLRAATSGLLAEAKVQNGTLVEVKNIGGKRGRPAGGKNKVPASTDHEHVTVAVPRGHERTFRALLATLGYREV